jgi:hypothetical protein
MPLKNGMITPQENMYVQAVVRTGDPVQAAKEAGYKHPAQRAHDIAQRPAIQAEISRVQQERLFNEILPLAVEAHKQLLLDPRTPAGAKVQAVKLAYDRTMGSDEKAQKEPHEMSAAELATMLDKLKREASDRSKPAVIEHEPTPEPGVFA